MNKKLLVALALVGALLSGWLLVSVASVKPAPMRQTQVPAKGALQMPIRAPAYVAPKQTGNTGVVKAKVYVGTRNAATIKAKVSVVKK